MEGEKQFHKVALWILLYGVHLPLHIHRCTYITHKHTHIHIHRNTYTETHSHRLKKLTIYWIQLYFSRLLSTFLVASVKLYETHWAYEILHIHFISQTLKTKAHFPALSMGSTWTAPKASSHRTATLTFKGNKCYFAVTKLAIHPGLEPCSFYLKSGSLDPI